MMRGREREGRRGGGRKTVDELIEKGYISIDTKLLATID